MKLLVLGKRCGVLILKLLRAVAEHMVGARQVSPEHKQKIFSIKIKQRASVKNINGNNNHTQNTNYSL